jgi:ParB family chromosome partitioning protein
MLGKGLESLIPPKPGNEQNNGQPNEPVLNQPVFQPSPIFPAVNPNTSSITPSAFINPSVFPPPSVSAEALIADFPDESQPSSASNGLPTEDAVLTPAQASTLDYNPLPATPLTQAIVPDTDKNLSVLKSLDYEADENMSDKKSEAVFQIEVEKIVPNPEQPRRHFDEESLRELANSIREFGIIQPLIVSKISEEKENGTEVHYELIAGERRLMAAKMVGLRTVPAIVKHISVGREKLELAIIENIQRADLNPVEEARAYSRLQDEFRMTQREIASRLGKSRETVANAMRLLNLPSEIQTALETGQLNESQARLLLQIDDIAKQKDIFYSILTDKPSVRALKQRIKDSSSPKTEVRSVNPTLDAIKNRLEEILGTKVDIKTEGDKGRITINFYSSEELSSLIEKIVRQNDNQSL